MELRSSGRADWTEAALAPTADGVEQGPDTLRPKGVWNSRSPSTLRGPPVTQSSMSETPMKISMAPLRSGSASWASFRQGELRMSSRLGGIVEAASVI